MKLLNFGSLNIDKTYEVEEIVKEGETVSALKHEIFLGGKGLNQSIALSRAGLDVYHAGKVGNDGQILVDELLRNGVNVDNITVENQPSGHAIIQIDNSGRNSIIVEGGTNRNITKDQIEMVLHDFKYGDWLLLQNEISNLAYLIDKAHEKGMKIALNASPIDKDVLELDYNKVTLLFINETEGYKLTGESDPTTILDKLLRKYPDLRIVLTLGKQGSIYSDKDSNLHCEASIVDAIDTTGAGDTFTGYFLAHYFKNNPVDRCLHIASKASGIAVTRKGASNSIPLISEIETI